MNSFRVATPFVRDLRAGDWFQTFLVTAVSTVLVVRSYLALTGYPQLGNDVLHIAHVLPGGLLMLVAIILMLGFLNKESKALAAFLGGSGSACSSMNSASSSPRIRTTSSSRRSG